MNVWLLLGLLVSIVMTVLYTRYFIIIGNRPVPSEVDIVPLKRTGGTKRRVAGPRPDVRTFRDWVMLFAIWIFMVIMVYANYYYRAWE